MFWKKRKLMQIGPTAAVDPKEITAIYIEDGKLVIRFSGIGVIKLHRNQLHETLVDTYQKLLAAKNR